MPELSDVEGFRRYFARYAAGRQIASVSVEDRSLLRNTSPQGIGRGLAGRTFAKPERHGKWLIAGADGPEVLMHFGMTGRLVWTSRRSDAGPHDRVTFELGGGSLHYRNMRKFGGIWLIRKGGSREDATGRLGPDALGIGEDEFAELLGRRRGQVKPALMDQRLLAGLGNLLSDEILWRARINPRSRASRLRSDRIKRLYACMSKVLADSIPHGRVPPDPDWLTGARNDRDPRCPRCGSALRRETIGGRTAVFCPRCQRR